jgi:RNA polymerase sigma-70 factor (ECF subfamily)
VPRGRLTAVFASVARISFPDPEATERALRKLCEQAEAAWPSLPFDGDAFVRYLAERWPSSNGSVAALKALRAPELALTQACVRGDPQALELLDRLYLAQVQRYLPKLGALGRDLDEVKQLLRERLLLSPPGESPRIASYRGQGPLGAWIRTVAARAAMELDRKAQARETSATAEFERLVTFDDPELSHNRRLYLGEIKEAFQAALDTLHARDTSILKLHYIDGMSASDVGRLYRVNARTVQRWMAESRSRIVELTRARLRRKLGLSGSQLDSLEKLARSQLDVSIERILARKQ